MTNNLAQITKEEHLKRLKWLVEEHPELDSGAIADEISALETPGLGKAYFATVIAVVGGLVALKYGPQVCEAVGDYFAK